MRSYHDDFSVYLTKIIQSFLAHRSCYVKIGNEKSSIYVLPAGVPQGSTMSPALFNIYASDLKLPNSEYQLALFVDDTAIFFSHLEPSPIINNIEKALS